MMLRRDDFVRRMCKTISYAKTGFNFGELIVDIDAAWNAYEADPDRSRWHAVTADNPSGEPTVALLLEDGPWWIDASTLDDDAPDQA